MDLFKRLLALTSIGFMPFSYGQIVTKGPEKEVKDTTVRVRRIPTDGLNEFCFYVGAGRVFANRQLSENKAPYGEPLGFRADEAGLKAWSFQIGMRNRVSSFLSYDLGVAFDRMGESYLYEAPDSDSTFSYKTRYSYFSVPAQVLFTYGKDLRFFIGGGLQPQLFAGYRQEQEWTTETQAKDDKEITSAKGLNTFALGILASAGVQFRLGNKSSLYILPSMLWNVTSTYDSQAEYIHKGVSFNLKFGLAFHIPQ